LEGVRTGLKRLPKKVVADAAYGSEENYAYLEAHQMENYLKYNSFYQDTHHYRNPEVIRKHQFRADHSGYDDEKDQFICPAKQRLSCLYTSKYKTANGYESERRHYGAQGCNECPLKSECTKAKGNRHLQVSFKLIEYRKQARENLTTELGKQ
jgi:hypothetical protein